MNKKLKYPGILMLSIIIAIAGCKKDEKKSLEEQLIGKWELQSAFYEYYENGIKTGEQNDTFEAGESVFEFSQDGTGNFYSYGTKEETFTWTFINPKIRVELSSDLIEGNISIEGNTLTLEGSLSIISGGTEYESYKTLKYKKI